MSLVQIGVKVEPPVKNRIKKLVDEGKYRDMTDFAVKAILEKLAREESPNIPITRSQLIHLLQHDPEIQQVFKDMIEHSLSRKVEGT